MVNYELIIIRYGEIALKGKKTRKHFENILIKNIKNALIKDNIQNKIVREWGRIYIYTKEIKKALIILKKIFGITSISPAIQTIAQMNMISKLCVNVSKEKLNKNRSFAVRVNRTGKHNFTSQDVAVRVGNDIVKTTKAIVNLTKPDFELFIEIRNKKAFIFTKKIRGVCGMPFKTQGRVLALIDSMYSILAAWFLVRRGCDVIFAVTKKSYLKILNSFIENWYLDSEIFILSLDKNFFKNINKIAHEKNCDAVVTGNSLFVNPKKTLQYLKKIKKSISLPVLHPLVIMDTKNISKKCRKIGIEL
ncbi:MAG: THUMP domain-containing protein [Candidatus Thermoplasmatota archaeon]|jgi:thiamine biosynthesis protein ThiI|nr:THUMP domain-containing protein [Candidatus Thermoplasmatota archaeon]